MPSPNKERIIMKHLKLAIVALLISTLAQAHHARFGFFSPDSTLEISGVVTELQWSNPHVRIVFSVTNSEGEAEEWHAELAALSSFRNRGITEAFVEVGEQISLFGRPSLHGVTEINPTNLLREDGTEVMLGFDTPQYFGARSTSQYVDPVASEASKQRAIEAADGIFRVWSTPPSTRAFTAFYGDMPLTQQAAEAKSQWAVSEELLQCWEKGMPLLMVTPHPVEFSRVGENIEFRYEEDDAVRTIYMGDADDNAESSLLGYSTGYWDGETLVVETGKIDFPIFDDMGTPQSDAVEVVEWFTPSENEQRLDYRIRVTDPATFTQPVELERFWIWLPERTIQEWNCVDIN